MQLPIKYSTGRYKPAGIPRVNWAHPLAQGLVFYGYDSGGGAVIDLVGSRQQSVGGTLATGNTSLGQGFQYVGGGVAVAFNSDAAVRNATVAPFTWATGFKASVLGTGVFGRQANSGASQPYLNWDFEANSSGTWDCNINSAGVFVKVGSSAGGLANAYQTLTGVAVNSSTARFYTNGVQAGSDKTGLTIQSVNSGDPVRMGLLGASGTQLYGAFWKRALTPAEILLLHTDPFCFLIYPDDEIFALVTSNAYYAPVSGLASTTYVGSTTATVVVGNATGGVSPYTYQWYRSTSPGFTPGGGNIIGGATSQTLNDTGLSTGTTYYYKNVVTDNAAFTSTSNETSASPAVLAVGAVSVVSQGDTVATVTVAAATGGDPSYTYQWYRSTSSGFTPGGGNIIGGATSRTLNDTGLTNGTTYYYKNIVTDSLSATATSSQLTVLPEAECYSGSWFGIYSIQPTPSIPTPASTWGYRRLAFEDDFNSLSTIDVNNTLAPGFKWYVQSLVLGTYPTNTLIAFAPSSFSVNNSILTYQPNTPVGDPVSGGNIFSAGYKADNTFVGNTIAPTGFYAEVRMAYNPNLVNGLWFPAFWMWDKSIMYNSGTNTAYGSNRYTEFDIFESSSPTTTAFGEFDWTSPSNQVLNTNYNLGFPNPIDDKFHTYGLLWVPQAQNGGTGIIQRWIDGVHRTGGDVSYSSSTISAQAGSGATTGWMSGADASTMGFTVQLQTGSNTPIYVDYVRIWQL